MSMRLVVVREGDREFVILSFLVYLDGKRAVLSVNDDRRSILNPFFGKPQDYVSHGKWATRVELAGLVFRKREDGWYCHYKHNPGIPYKVLYGHEAIEDYISGKTLADLRARSSKQ